MKRNSDYFNKVDDFVARYKNSSTTLFRKVQAIDELFKLTIEIVPKGYHDELLRLFTKVANKNLLPLFAKSIEALGILYDYSQQATYFNAFFKEIKEKKDAGDTAVESTITENESVMELIKDMEPLILMMNKYPFKPMILHTINKNRDTILFKKIAAE